MNFTFLHIFIVKGLYDGLQLPSLFSQTSLEKKKKKKKSSQTVLVVLSVVSYQFLFPVQD